MNVLPSLVLILVLRLVFATSHNVIWLAEQRRYLFDWAFENHSKPIRNKQSTMFLSVNGEIYNYLSIKEQLIAENPEFENEFVSDSDCEPVMYLYKKYGLGFLI